MNQDKLIMYIDTSNKVLDVRVGVTISIPNLLTAAWICGAKNTSACKL